MECCITFTKRRERCSIDINGRLYRSSVYGAFNSSARGRRVLARPNGLYVIRGKCKLRFSCSKYFSGVVYSCGTCFQLWRSQSVRTSALIPNQNVLRLAQMSHLGILFLSCILQKSIVCHCKMEREKMSFVLAITTWREMMLVTSCWVEADDNLSSLQQYFSPL